MPSWGVIAEKLRSSESLLLLSSCFAGKFYKIAGYFNVGKVRVPYRIVNAGHYDQRAAASLHVEDQGKGHAAGDGREEIPACPGVQVLTSRQEVAGVSGHGAEEISHGDIHKRVFLARASGV